MKPHVHREVWILHVKKKEVCDSICTCSPNTVYSMHVYFKYYVLYIQNIYSDR